MVECKRCLLTDRETVIDGTCEFCKIHDKLEKQSSEKKLSRMVKRIKRKKGFNCLMGISGGVDSCYLLHWAIKEGLNPLVVHFDNGYNSFETGIATSHSFQSPTRGGSRMVLFLH